MNGVCWWTGYELYPDVLFFFLPRRKCDMARRYTIDARFGYIPCIAENRGDTPWAWPLVRLSPTVAKRTTFNDEDMTDQMKEYEDLLGAAC